MKFVNPTNTPLIFDPARKTLSDEGLGRDYHLSRLTGLSPSPDALTKVIQDENLVGLMLFFSDESALLLGIDEEGFEFLAGLLPADNKKAWADGVLGSLVTRVYGSFKNSKGSASTGASHFINGVIFLNLPYLLPILLTMMELPALGSTQMGLCKFIGMVLGVLSLAGSLWHFHLVKKQESDDQ